MSQDKLKDSLELQARRLSDKEKFETELNIDGKRTLLMQRIQAIKASNITQVIIPKDLADTLLKWFTDGRDLSSRDQRDFPRLIDLVKAHALFQMFQREKTPGSCSVIANKEDVAAAQGLLNKVLEANRLGLPPYVHKFYFESLEPSITENGITRGEFSKSYFTQFKERLGEKARKQLIDLLSDAGLLEETQDPEDKRKMKIYIPLKGGEKKQEKSEVKSCFLCNMALPVDHSNTTIMDGKEVHVWCFKQVNEGKVTESDERTVDEVSHALARGAAKILNGES